MDGMSKGVGFSEKGEWKLTDEGNGAFGVLQTLDSVVDFASISHRFRHRFANDRNIFCELVDVSLLSKLDIIK